MVQAIREIVTVGADGMIRVQAPESQRGARAEVIVLLDSRGNEQTAANSLTALDRLQQSLNLTGAQAQEWADQSAVERKASSRL